MTQGLVKRFILVTGQFFVGSRRLEAYYERTRSNLTLACIKSQINREREEQLDSWEVDAK